jgi:ribosomal protein L40E
MTPTVVVWFASLIILLVLVYFYWRDRKARKTKVKEKVKRVEDTKDSGKDYTILIREDGSFQVVFRDGEAGEKLSRGNAKVFPDRGRMMKFLGGAITYDLPEIIPDEKGTYVLILHVWKNKVNPDRKPELREAPVGKSGKSCKSCGTQNDSDARYCKKCGKQLN